MTTEQEVAPGEGLKNKGGRPPKFNWPAIRKDYENTRMSGYELAEKWKVDPSLVYKHAVNEGWSRLEGYKPSFANFMDDNGMKEAGPYSIMHRDYLLEQIAYGRTMRAICSEPGMPCESSVYYWMQRDDNFKRQYFEAKEIAGLVLGEQVMGVNDDIAKVLKNANPSAVHVSALKLKSDNLKWGASKLAPKMYGDKSKVDLSSEDGTMSAPPAMIKIVAGSGEEEG